MANIKTAIPNPSFEITTEHHAALYHYSRPPMSRDAKAVGVAITHDLQSAGWIGWTDLGEGHAWCLTDRGLIALQRMSH